jgi:hypothetical protein
VLLLPFIENDDRACEITYVPHRLSGCLQELIQQSMLLRDGTLRSRETVLGHQRIHREAIHPATQREELAFLQR